jgi:WD40 repeat protein
MTTRPDLLAVVRHLACSQWRISSRNVVRDFGISPARSRDLDDDRMLWPLDVSADGRACAFAASEGVVIVVDETGTARELRDPRGLDECILSGDATLATCIAGHAAVATYDVASGSRRSVREIDHGVVRGLVRYRDAVLVLVARPTGCVFEDANGALHGHVVARECQRVRASNASQPGQESALVVTRPRAVDLWTERGTMTIPTEGELVEMSAAGLIAVGHEQTIEIWDARTRSRIAGPPPHTRAIERLAWSSRGTLATADDETVRLWDAATGVVRVIYAPHTLAMTWSHDGDTLFTSDGRTLDAWTVAINRGSSQREARARLEQLTSARIGDGDVATP